jgi:signal recognition particle subunit SRP54
MFESLTTRFQALFSRIRSKGIVRKEDLTSSLREIRLALLEADVNYHVVKDLLSRVEKRALGAEVLESLTPAQQIVKIVHQELTALMGSTVSKFSLSSSPTVIMVVGLQGSGKTTFCGKLARYLIKKGKNTLLVPADLRRPAAVDQLITVAREAESDVYEEVQAGMRALEVCHSAIKEARKRGSDAVVMDTAGRLHIDMEMMGELAEIRRKIKPHEILLVVDAMTGQDAVNIAQKFKEYVDYDGIVLTKLDSDTRGGAALSIRAITEKPVKFVSVGEKLDDLEPFYPDRIASRILGMGDVLSLIEKAQQLTDEKKAKEIERKIISREFDLEDFLDQINQVGRLGSLSQVMEMLPGWQKFKGSNKVSLDEKRIRVTKAIIQSMTREERRKPSLIDGSRKKRIARGSSTSIVEVNRLLKQFEQVKSMMRHFSRKKGIKGFPFLVP